MIFGPVPTEAASGALLAHSLSVGERSFRKGHVLSEADIAELARAGVHQVVVARLESGEVGEDPAAAAVARALAGDGVRVAEAATGRVNLYAESHGLLLVDAPAVDRINAVNEAITLATLPSFAVVRPQQMLATVKIIPFAAPAAAVEACMGLARQGAPPLCVAPFRPHRAGLVQTRLSGTRASVLEKTAAVTGARLQALGSVLEDALVVEHREAAVAGAVVRHRQRGLDPILLLGASAIADRRDVIPAAVEALGGEVLHFGMPVDPGNLLLLARLGGAAVLGLPGCARSPKLNGFDWVLQRLLAGVPVHSEDIVRMGVGGLLSEIPSRPQPREAGGARPASQR